MLSEVFVADGNLFTMLFSFYLNYKHKWIITFTYHFQYYFCCTRYFLKNESFKNDYYVHFACHAYEFYTNKYPILSSDNSLNGMQLAMTKRTVEY
jgi:hypothetical protein